MISKVTSDDSRNHTRNILLVMLAWAIIIVALGSIGLNEQYQNLGKVVRMQALEAFQRDDIYRAWGYQHGGVYVPVTKETPPNAHLIVPHRDVETTNGRKLTLINPAYMTRQVHELARKEYGVEGHLTSLKPLRPANKPDPWEALALQQFETGVEEVAEVVTFNSQEYFRLMRPLYMEPVCMGCHAVQGYKLGDIRGGMSVSVPMAPFIASFREQAAFYVFTHFIIWLLVSAGIIVSGRKIVTVLKERKQANETLSQSELLLKNVSNMAHNWEYWIDEHRQFLYISPSCEAITGYSSRFFVDDPQNLNNIILAEDLPAWKEHDAVHAAADGKRSLEFRIRRADGEIRWINHVCRPVREKQGFQGFRVSNTDITENKLNEIQLELQNRRFSALLELPSAAEKNDEKGLMQAGQEMAEDLTDSQISFIHLVNDDEETIELVAWSRRTLENYCTAVSDSHYPVSQAGIWAEALRQRKPVIVNDYDIFPNKKGLPEGHAHLQRFISVPVMQDGKVVMMTGVGNKETDYTQTDVETVQLLSNDIWRFVQYKRSEQEMRKLVHVVEQSPEMILITNVDGEIEYVNDTFEKNTGYRLDEIVGQTPGFLDSGQTPEENFKALYKALENGETWQGEFYNRRKDGSEFIEFARVTPLRNPDGRVTHYVALKEDITRRKQLGKELDQYRNHLEDLVNERSEMLFEALENAQAANMAKSEFLANMSHEIRTPMNAIIGLAHLMQNDELAEIQQKRLSKISGSAQHLLSIINDILDLSKIEAGKLVLEEIDFDLEEIFNSIKAIISDQAKEKGINVSIEIEENLRWLKGDSTRIRQAMLNYSGNAVKFTRQGEIRLRAIKTHEDGDEITVRFEVEDTGIGIDKDVVDRLFDSFKQADNSTTREYGGTGLGLAITKRIANLMKGEVGVDTEPGKGSVFWFTARLKVGLPQDNNRSMDLNELKVDKIFSNEKILLVEDNAINREVATEILVGFGVTVDSAENGAESLDMVQRHDYDLVLMDMQMPVMDGLEAARRIRALPDKKDLPILALTANAFAEDRDACIAAGMNDFIVKPVDPQKLFVAMAKWLEKLEEIGLSEGQLPKLPDVDIQQKIPEALLEVIGLDVQRGMQNVNGDLKIYLKLMRQFVATHKNDMKIIRSLHENDLREDAIRMAHTIKGASGTLGYLGLQKVSANLEQVLKQDWGNQDLIAMETAEITVFFESLDNALGTIEQPQYSHVSNKVNAEELRELLDKLQSLLELNDIDTEALIDQSMPVLNYLSPELGKRLLQEVESFDFEDALGTLSELKKKLK